MAVSGTTKINRKDYGLTWNAALETGGILVGEEITITLEVEFVKGRLGTNCRITYEGVLCH